MDLRGRADRSTAQGFRIGDSAADLIGDIHRQQRRRLLRRAAQLTALGVALLLVGLAFKFAADRRAQSRTLEQVRRHFERGTVVEIRAAIDALEESLTEHPSHEPTLAARALARMQLWMEFGEQEQEARDAVLAVETSSHGDAVLARAMAALADGDAEAALAALPGADADQSLAPGHSAWVFANIALAGDGSAVAEARSRLEGEGSAATTARERIGAALILASGDGREALDALERAREQNRTHMGLAADEALYNAYLRQELSGVADVADQLLRSEGEVLSARDRAHARLARGVVHVQTGEAEAGLERIEEAWPLLPAWDRAARELALQAALEAGDAARVDGWLKSADLPEEDAGVYRAWAALASGRLMDSLEQLAKLPQERPRVAYLQALALVEQRRFEEAKAWITRTQKLLPGRIEVEVAQARVQLHTGDKEAALNKLKALAEEEPYAPRAWTGLGEAHRLQETPELRLAQEALERAVEREPVPAEALLQLGYVHVERRAEDPEGASRALEYFERAAAANPHEARYEQVLALHLADLGRTDRAISLLEKIADRPGVEADALLTLARLSIDAAQGVDDELRARVDGWIDAADKLGVEGSGVLQARAALALAGDDRAAWEQARADLEAYITTDPADVGVRILLANAYVKLGDRDAGESVVRKGLAATPPGEHGLLYLEWARIESRGPKRKWAASHGRTAWTKLAASNEPPRILVEAADFACSQWLKQSKPRPAAAIARQLTEVLPDHADAWAVRAAAQLAGGFVPEAQASAERALELDDQNARAHELLGHALIRSGRRDEAKTAYEKAIELARGTPDEARYRDNLKRL